MTGDEHAQKAEEYLAQCERLLLNPAGADGEKQAQVQALATLAQAHVKMATFRKENRVTPDWISNPKDYQ
jgi:hypothetical protein